MLRRVFLLQILLGTLIAIGEKLRFQSLNQPVTAKLSKKLASKYSSSSINNLDSLYLYISPNGNDAWSGRRETANYQGTDGPLASLTRAKMVVKQLKSLPQNSDRPIQVLLRGGTYALTAPIVFEPQDSGSINQPITYRSYPREQAIISGGAAITGWQKETVNGLSMWTVQLSPQTKFQQLWVNGIRRLRSRYPRQGYLKVKALNTTQGQTWMEGHSDLEYHQEDLANLDPDALIGAEAVVMSRWVESRLPVTKVDPVQRKIYFSKESVFQLAKGDLFYLENSLGWLQNPGEWYLNSQGKLFYVPLPGEDLHQAEVIAPQLDSLILFRGNGANNLYVQHLKFRNLTFAHTDCRLPVNISGYNQNAWEVTSAVKAIALQNCSWNSCIFSQLGNHALHLAEDCQYNSIARCIFVDLGGGGIKVGHKRRDLSDFAVARGTHHNLIIGNHLYDGGKFFHSAAAIAIVQSHHNFVAHNQVHDYYYTGITVMGTWSFQPTQAYQNLVKDNHIHHIGKLSNGDGPILSDMGGVYILGYQEGTRVRNNKIHDINALRYGGWGIYLDEGSSYIVVENNLVYQTSHGGFAQHYGKENLIRYNIFALGKESQIHRHRKDIKTAQTEDFISFRFENNIVYWQSGQLLSGSKGNYQSHSVFQNNIYWKTGQKKFMFGDLSWQQWQKGDRNSLITDPQFEAPGSGNFKLKPNSPASKIIPLSLLNRLSKEPD